LLKKKKIYKAAIEIICEVQERAFYKEEIRRKYELKKIGENLQM
jgi:hypothetical protein